MPRVQIQIVTWNNRKDIAAALESVFTQSFLSGRQAWRDFSVVVVDNASEDGTMDILKSYGRDITVLSNRKNLGFARAHNQAFAFALQSRVPTDYLLVMNPDGSLTPSFLEQLVHFAQSHGDGAAFTGKVLRESGAGAAVIDTTGIAITRSFRSYDRGAGEADHGQFNEAGRVFGASGAFAFYRVSALKSVAKDGSMYDPDFFMYKEDVDLAWRFERAGYYAYYVPEAVAFHSRTVRAPKKGIGDRLVGEFYKDPRKKYWSYRNQQFTLIKNLTVAVFLKHGFWILIDRIAEGAFMLVVHPKYFFKATAEIVSMWARMRKKHAL